MTKIIIRNVGPIKEAEFDLNKVNVFMGPQSSGKSTIAKIISYCDWVEKDVATSQSLKTYQDNKTHFRDHLENFHKIKKYFRPDSYISYKSDVVEIKWENQLCDIKWVDQYAYKRSKISYIPSERNMIILPEIEKVEFGNTNIRSFLFDWFDARKKYPIENKLSILNLNVDYYYVDNGIVKEDRISGKANDIEYDILLSNASSGLQSITPLIAMIDYLTYWIYNEDKTSFDLQENERKVDRYLIDEKVNKTIF
jgi:predicted ATPase